MKINELKQKYRIEIRGRSTRLPVDFARTALDILREEQGKSLNFNIKEIDMMLMTDPLRSTEPGMGIPVGKTMELFGRGGSGKSQLSFHLAINCTLPVHRGGLNRDVLYIDTEGKFSPARLAQMSRTQNLNEEDTLNRIAVARPRTTDELFQIVNSIEDNLEGVGLIVVDSIIALFRSEFVGLAALSERQQLLNQLLGLLKTLAGRHNLIVLITNQIQSDMNDHYRATGGSIVEHWAYLRCMLRPAENGRRIIRIVNSPVHDNAETLFEINSRGVQAVYDNRRDVN